MLLLMVALFKRNRLANWVSLVKIVNNNRSAEYANIVSKKGHGHHIFLKYFFVELKYIISIEIAPI